VNEKLKALLKAGFPAETLELGLELITDSNEHYVDYYENHKDVDYSDLSSCMDVALDALREVNWTLDKKLLWAVDIILIDRHSVSDCFWKILRKKHSSEIWGTVANALLERVDKCIEQMSYCKNLLNMTAYALTQAKRKKEVLVLRQNEAVSFNEYLPVVKLLLENKSEKEAEEWIYKGLANTEKISRYDARELRSYLLALRIKQKNWDAALCMQTEDFVQSATLEHYRECQSSAEELNVWHIVRPLLLSFLVEGAIPWTQESWPCQNRGEEVTAQRRQQPYFGMLIAVAIHEKNPVETLKWYDLYSQATRLYGYDAEKISDNVATAVQDFSFERAIAIWKDLSAKKIALTKPKAYEEAAVFMKKMGRLKRQHGMTEQWDAYIQSLRTEFRRRPRLMEVLDKLSI
jgi:uncharacterized Zn finger protein